MKFNIRIIFIVLLFGVFVGVVSGLNESVSITKEEALSSLGESERIIEEMEKNNLSVIYMNDMLIEANIIFEQARNAEILRNQNSNASEKSVAKIALGLVRWQDVYYENVSVYTEDIKQRRDMAFLLMDRFTIEKSKINEDVSMETVKILDNAIIAFQDERYGEAEDLLGEFEIALEQEMAERSTLSGIRDGAKNFFQRYWIYIMGLLVLFCFTFYFIYKKIRKMLVKKRIVKMKAEEKVLLDLMKGLQRDRFEKNEIPGLVYNIRMKKYKERLQEIKEMLPVLEKRVRV